MTLLVPFDGSALSEAALERATEFAEFTGEDVLVLTVVPDEPEYALSRNWLDANDPFDPDAIAERLRERVADIAPGADFRYEIPEDVSSMASCTTDVIRTIRTVAHEVGASIVFIGSENAGRVSSPVSSVGAPVSEDPGYDVYITRHA
ncbi:universal stress protein [Haloarcula salinisoli]|uniref:Universal stress protein n=1 Tax=Haloarcula salinisoli TaxID=2487746 RepID=A0A8J7YKA0_9EURY|nr:universal stress protein [Halomicroarcula salinisoli]MBX0287765.1 universal stress protein [Halomicroarcula salinisoli]MBX0304689.1 universal stress protein [Halomicroarcula salinisoli]